MTFEIQISESAVKDVRLYSEFIAMDSKQRSEQWQRGLYDLIFSLEEFPYRVSFADQTTPIDLTLRSFPYHSHIIFYRVNEILKVVTVYRVWPGQMVPSESSQLF